MVKNLFHAISLMVLSLTLIACGGTSGGVRLTEAQASAKHVRALGEESGCAGGGTVTVHTVESDSWHSQEQRERIDYRGLYSQEMYRNIGHSRRARMVENCLQKPVKPEKTPPVEEKKK